MSIVSWLLVAVAVVVVLAIVAWVTRSRRSAAGTTDEAVPVSGGAVGPDTAADPDTAVDQDAPEPERDLTAGERTADDAPVSAEPGAGDPAPVPAPPYRPGDPVRDDPTLTDGHEEDLFTHDSEPAVEGGATASSGIPEPRTGDPATNGAAADGGTGPHPVSATRRWDAAAPGPTPDTPAAAEVGHSSGPDTGSPGAAAPERADVAAPGPAPAGGARVAPPTDSADTTVPSMSVADGAPLWTVSAEDMARSEPSSGSAMASLDSGLVGPAGAGTSSGPAPAGDTPAGAAPYPGAVYAPADGSEPPSSHPVKVHTGSGRYHTAESPYYIRTRADLYFVGVGEAEAAGFVAWNSRPGGAR